MSNSPDPVDPPDAGSGHRFVLGPEPRAGDDWRRLLDRLRSRLPAGQSVGVVVALALVAVACWWWANAPDDASGGASGPFLAGGTTIAFASSTTSIAPGSDTTIAPGVIVVHAAGAVQNPGVYRLDATARIGDLVATAGGFGPDADLDRLNLAEPLRDGVRVYVPVIGEDQAPPVAELDGPAPDQGGGGGATAGPGGPTGASEPIDLNTASLDELDELPGVGPATAQAIVSFREANGPFGSVDALLEVRGIGPAKLEQIRPLVRT